MKKVDLVEVPESKKSVLRQLIELYEYDLSTYTAYELNEHGYYGYSYLDYYWTEERRYPYFIMFGEKIAGFVLVNDYCEVSTEKDSLSIAEFFVLKIYRKQGIGQKAAEIILDRFPGAWEIQQYLENTRSLTFWEKVIGEYTSGNFEKKIINSNDGEKQVILFNNKKGRSNDRP